MDIKLNGRVVDEDLHDVTGEIRVRALGAPPNILFSGELSGGRINRTVSVPATWSESSFALELKVGDKWVPLTRPTKIVNERVSFGTIVQLSTTIEGRDGPQIGLQLREVGATFDTLAEQARLAERARTHVEDELAEVASESANRKLLVEQQTERAQQLDESLAALQAQLQASQKTVMQLEQELAGRGAVEPVQLNQMWSDVGGQLQKTTSELKATNAGVKLGKVTMEVKAVAMQDGSGIKIGLPSVEQLKQLPSGSLSTLVYEFLPSEPAPVQPAHIGVPRVIGYTEPMAKRVLTHTGFFADVAFIASADAAEVGRVVRQEPPPATDLAPGSVVVIYMGKQLA